MTKQFLLLFLFSFSTAIAFAQRNNNQNHDHYRGMDCRMAMPDRLFETEKNNILRNRSEQIKFEMAMRLLDNNCVSAYQAKTIASMFLNEANRLDFAQYAFDKCIDPENFYALLDCFSSFSSAFILYDYMSHRSGFMEPVRVMDPVVSEIPSQVPVQMQCVVTPADLEMIKNIIKNESFEGNKESTAKNAIASKACFSTQQIIEILKLFTYENTKVALAKYCFDYCIDVPNYYQVSTIFTYSTSKTDFNAFLAAKQR